MSSASSAGPPLALLAAFERQFRRKPEVLASAPAVVRFLGDDSGVEEGVILAGALPMRVTLAVAKRPDRRAFLRTTFAGGETALTLEKLAPSWDWTDAISGVVAAFEQIGRPLPGFEMYVDNPIPGGAGLGSSCALSAAAAAALAQLAGLELDGLSRARLCRRGEAALLGFEGALAPHVAAALARPGEGVLFDGRDATVKMLPVRLGEYRLLVADSGYRRPASATESDRRREAAENALAAIHGMAPGAATLRDIDLESLPEGIDSRHARRCRHFALETRRAFDSAGFLEEGELAGFGRLLTESNQSLRLAFAPLPRELEDVTRLLGSAPGVLGARSADGTGESGSAIALVEAGSVSAVLDRLARFHYREDPSRIPVWLMDGLAGGARAGSC